MGNLDINIGKLKKNAFRYSKVRGETASRIRIPGGVIDANSMSKVVEIAEKYGTGVINITNRQGIEIPGISLKDMDKVNAEVQEIIDALRINQPEKGKGYPSSGTRNVIACPGARLCPFGCYDTTAFAQKMENQIYPNDRHVKIAFTGCSNDCGKVRMDDFGFIGMTEPQYDPNRCVSCEQCIKYCNIRSVGALSLVNGKVVRDADKCIGCGVCVAYCPTRAWTRSKEHYFRVVIMGRTGKKNPRLAEDFVKWADEESIFKMVRNAYAYVEEYIDPNALEGKEHIGYIVDRTGFDEFCKWVLKDVNLNEKAEVASRVYWGGKHYDRSNNLM
jgi:anaerobic sulfite reductase subunit C